jgi:hypothetical protein
MKLPTSKQELLGLIEQEHAELDRWVEALDDVGLSKVGVPAGWTEEAATEGVAVKDILNHLAEWEKRMLAYLALALNVKPLQDARFSLTAPKFNRAIFEANRHRPALELKREYRETYGSVLATLQALDEATLLRVNAGGLISYNTYNHYRWAIRKVRPWLRRQKQTLLCGVKMDFWSYG